MKILIYVAIALVSILGIWLLFFNKPAQQQAPNLTAKPKAPVAPPVAYTEANLVHMSAPPQNVDAFAALYAQSQAAKKKSNVGKPDFNALSADAKAFFNAPPVVTENAFQYKQVWTWKPNTKYKSTTPPESVRQEIDAYLKALTAYDRSNINENSFYIDSQGGWTKGSKSCGLTLTIRETLKQNLTTDYQQWKRDQASSGNMKAIKQGII